MKKTIVFIIFIALSKKQYAQIEKGTYVPSIAINGGFTNNPSKDSTYSIKSNTLTYGTNLGFGRFVKDNLLLTGSFSYGHSSSKLDYVDDTYSYNNYGNSSFSNSEGIGVSLLKYKFLTENFAIRYGSSFSASYTETINRRYNNDNPTINPQTGTYMGYQEDINNFV
jgi:hypothetical protein